MTEVLIAYDGSPAAQRAVRSAAALLAPCRALVVVVWEPGQALTAAAAGSIGIAPVTTLDVRTSRLVDDAARRNAQALADAGVALAEEVGFAAEGLVVADDLTVADTLLRVAGERRCAAVVVGSHGHSALGELLGGSTTRTLLRHATCPVVVVRDPAR